MPNQTKMFEPTYARGSGRLSQNQVVWWRREKNAETVEAVRTEEGDSGGDVKR